jgi:hypothetical protein
MVPVAMNGLDHIGVAPAPFFALLASGVVGWVARYPRLAGVAGAITVPMSLLISLFYTIVWPYSGALPDPTAVFTALLAFGPLCWATARGAASARRWFERQGTPREWPAAER